MMSLMSVNSLEYISTLHFLVQSSDSISGRFVLSGFKLALNAVISELLTTTVNILTKNLSLIFFSVK